MSNKPCAERLHLVHGLLQSPVSNNKLITRDTSVYYSRLILSVGKKPFSLNIITLCIYATQRTANAAPQIQQQDDDNDEDARYASCTEYVQLMIELPAKCSDTVAKRRVRFSMIRPATSSLHFSMQRYSHASLKLYT